ncbi:transcription factor kayak isoform X2 [Atheta coriaria]|uniref:transcription factor kayak isoform X2 n=1 Tax=Dalotia coriaria TaxID=877792 RepID=UPI0031F3B681
MSQLVPYLNFGLDLSQADFEDCDMYTNYDPIAQKNKMFISLEGLHSGVPTRTTPTLTPTTLRSIEQTFIELQSKPHENEAGFVPPMVQSIGNNQYIPASEADIYTTITPNGKSNTIWNSNISQCSSEDSNTSPSPADLQKNMQSPPPAATTRRNMGGRRPNREVNLPPEEEERRRVRRERNKAAAARCRKRRVDHTNELLDETDELEKKKQELKQEFADLSKCRDELEELLERHRPRCKLTGMHCPPSPPEEKPYAMQFEHPSMQRVKTELIDTLQDDDYYGVPSPAKKIMLSSTVPISKPNRPNSLNVGGTTPFGMNAQATNNNSKSVFDDALAGIGITTPSTGMHFNFESLMVGGTGLTPVSAPLIPNCSTQQRIPVSMSGDIVSPESCVPPKLVSL